MSFNYKIQGQLKYGNLKLLYMHILECQKLFLLKKCTAWSFYSLITAHSFTSNSPFYMLIHAI